MRYIIDSFGRFAERPHYAAHELDWIFERIATNFLTVGATAVRFPLSTENLMNLLERDVQGLGQHRNSSVAGRKADGVIEFICGGKPRVTVAEKLARNETDADYLRTVLAHEYAHVHLHRRLYEQEDGSASASGPGNQSAVISCGRKTMISAAPSDWMEWQASYASGALLMPATYVKRLAAGYLADKAVDRPVASDSVHGEVIIDLIVKSFLVSRDAARVRLTALNILGPPEWTLIPSIFF